MARLVPAAVFVLVIGLAFLLWPEPGPPGNQPSIVLSGTVAHRAGAPLVGARVIVRAQMGGSWKQDETRTGSNGRWSVEIFGADRAAVTVRAIADGHRPEDRQATADPDARIDFGLTAYGEITGTAIFHGTRPQVLRAQRSEGEDDIWHELDLVESDDGEFRIVNVEPGPCLFRFVLRRWHLPHVRMEVPEGGTRALGEVIFPADGRIEGLVRDGEGRPLSRATVRLLGFEPEYVTGETGRFRFRYLPPGTYTVHVRDFESTREKEVEVQVESGKTLDLEIHLSD